MNIQTRMACRMYEGIQAGESYGCAVTRYETRNQRIWRRAHKVIYWTAPFILLWAVVA